MSQRSIPLLVFQDLLDSVDFRSVWNAQGHNSWYLSGDHPLALKIEFQAPVTPSVELLGVLTLLMWSAMDSHSSIDGNSRVSIPVS